MQFLKVGIVVCIAMGSVLFAMPVRAADSRDGVIISQVQAGGNGAATQEFVSLYNNSEDSVDVSGWCLTNKANVRFACVPENVPVLLENSSYFTIVSDSFALAYSSSHFDVVFATTNMSSGSIVGSNDTITLVDSAAAIVDSVSWAKSLAGGTALERNYIGKTCKLGDFVEPRALTLPVDCAILDEPIIDICATIEGIQETLPDDVQIDENGECYEDACPNLPDFQDVAPAGFYTDEDGNCRFGLLPIEVTELLPNPDGDDSGNEFIELYNPNTKPVSLVHHVFHLNGDFERVYVFPADLTIAPKSYMAVYNRDVSFTLTNASGSLRLRPLDATHVFDVPAYSDAKSGQSWALIDGTWQYTSMPTPGAENVVPVGGQGATGTSQADCGEGRERNPATNRCRNIPVASTLAPCKEGQYRSEETNRCRSIASAAVAALKPCADDQFRNPLTNRCKKIASSDDLADCGEGRERNPDTNRCRNVLGASSVPASTFAVQPIADGMMTFVGWWALGGVTFFALGYAGWEWRRELRAAVSRAFTFFSARK